MQQNLWGAGFPAVAGGLVLALVPLVDGLMPSAELLFWVPPLLLLVAARRVSELDDASLHAHRALRFGLGALCVAGLVNAVAFLIMIARRKPASLDAGGSRLLGHKPRSTGTLVSQSKSSNNF